MSYTAHSSWRSIRKAATLLLLALLPLTLGACGKKPGQVDPPVGVKTQDFPRVYPDPATDPKP